MHPKLQWPSKEHTQACSYPDFILYLNLRLVSAHSFLEITFIFQTYSNSAFRWANSTKPLVHNPCVRESQIHDFKLTVVYSRFKQALLLLNFIHSTKKTNPLSTFKRLDLSNLNEFMKQSHPYTSDNYCPQIRFAKQTQQELLHNTNSLDCTSYWFIVNKSNRTCRF